MKCPEGQYYCFDDEKCKPIPEGKKVREDGELVSEVAPPGYGHTKGDKKKGVEKGGTAAAFDRARKEGRFKGSKSDMFAIMWSQKNKGDKPHYKPGTNKKYKKYQEEQTSMKDNNLFGDAYAGSYEKLKKKIGSKKMHTKPAIEENKFVDAMVSAVKKRKEEKKPEKAMDAGAKARRMLKRREHAKYVSGSTENVPDDMREGSLHKWFKGSKSKDGKGGWVNVKTGGTCASDEPGEGTPKCVSSSKRASMTKAERDSASRRKKAADPNQQQKSGAAKPTYVSTDKPKKKMNEDKVLKTVAKELVGASKMHKGQSEKIKKHLKDMKKIDEACWKGYKAYGLKKKGGKMVPNCKPVGSVKKEEVEITEADKKGKGSGSKDACYHKVKASAKVWPSAYASGRLVQCRKKGAANYGKSKSESFSWRDELDYVQEGAAWTKKAGKNKSGGLNEKGRKSYEAENPGSDLKAPSKKVGNPRRKSFCARMKGMRKRQKPSNNTGDDRLSKSLRAWNC